MNKAFIMAYMLALLAVFVCQPSADMYNWMDKNGVIHFSDTPPASSKNVATYETTASPQTDEKIDSKRSKKDPTKSKLKDEVKRPKRMKKHKKKRWRIRSWQQ